MEIQKLDPLRDNFLTMVKKHNELVDAVNILQAQVAILEEHRHPTAKREPDDPYAEQRKWIGKLCKFWDDDPDDYNFNILKELTLDGGYVEEDGFTYDHCEPVKLDDDIIYKGGENSNIKSIRHIDSYEYDKLQNENKVEPDCLYIIE